MKPKKDAIDRAIDSLEYYFSKVKTETGPETEEEFLFTIDFWCFMLMHSATQEWQGWAGLVPIGTEVKKEDIISNFDPEIMKIIKKLVKLACKKFELLHPGQKEEDGKKTFVDWIQKMAKKYDRENRLRINGLILEYISEDYLKHQGSKKQMDGFNCEKCGKPCNNLYGDDC